MAHYSHGAVAAAHAAHEARRRQEQEEEEMTKYTSEDLEQNWEFKIVRASFPVFHKPEVFQSLLEEESLAGWELVEKLDDRRIRFKRRKEARRQDAILSPGIDPYRTQYGTNTNAVGVVIGIIFAVLLAGIVAAMALIESPLINFEGDIPWVLVGTVIPVLVILFGIAAIVIVRLRRY